jgi:hypothetical protein
MVGLVTNFTRPIWNVKLTERTVYSRSREMSMEIWGTIIERSRVNVEQIVRVAAHRQSRRFANEAGNCHSLIVLFYTSK